MARVGTSNLNLGTYTDGEYPGAGSQTIDSDGLNGNMIKMDRAVGTEHNADGSHKSNVIKGSNLIQSGANSCVDGATLEFSSNSIRVKANGLTGSHMNQTAGQTVDGTTLEFNANAIRVKDASISAAKLATDAVTDAKILRGNNAIRQVQAFSKASTAAGFLAKEGITMSNGQGMTLPHDFVITGLSFLDAAGVRENIDLGYDAGTYRIQSTECLSLYWSGTVLEIRKGGVAIDTFTPSTAPTTNFIVYITWEPYK